MDCSVSGVGTTGYLAGEAGQHGTVRLSAKTVDTLPVLKFQLASTYYL